MNSSYAITPIVRSLSERRWWICILRVLLLLLPLQVHGQEESLISGQVTIEGSTDADGVTVLALSPRDSTVIAYALTSPEGAYEFTIRSSLPKLLLSAFRMDTKRDTRLVDNRSQRLDFRLKGEAYDLKEVLVTAPTVYRQGDTLSYVVSKLAGASDEVISDVLARVPGMRVKQGGMLEYLGKSVSTVMIEGVDLTQGSYGLITENVKPRDISAIEVLQAYQRVRALKGKDHSDDVAVNLKLSNRSKGIWSGTADVAVGYGKGLRTSDRVTLQYFAPRVQHLMLGYVDNTGHPRVEQLTSPEESSSSLRALVEGVYSAPSELPEETYLDNRTGYLSQSSALVPSDSTQLKLQTHYTYSLLRKWSDRQTHFIDPPTDLAEETRLRDRRHEALVEGDYEVNKTAYYLQDHFTLSYRDLSEPGHILTADEQRSDRASRARLGGVRNRLRYVLSRGALPLEATLRLGYDRAGERFDITSSPPEQIRQELLRDRVEGAGDLRLTDIRLGKWWRFVPSVALQYSQERFERPLIAGLRRADATLGQLVEYKGPKLHGQLALPVGYLHLQSLSERGEQLGRWYLLPSAYLKWTPSFRWSLDGSASMGQQSPAAEQFYPGILYTDYRTMVETEEVQLHVDRTLLGYGRVTYSDVFHLLSLFVRARYLSHRSDYLADYEVTERWTRIRPTYAPHRLSQVGVDLQLSKGFGWKGLTTILDLSLDRTETEVMTSGTRRPYRSDALRGGLQVSLAPSRRITLDYRCSPLVTWSRYGSEATFRSLQLRQRASLYWTLVPSKLFLDTRVDYSLVRHDSVRGDSMILHADLSYRPTERWTVELLGDNLLGATHYDQITYTDYGQQIARYPLRPRTVMLRTRLTF